MMRMKRIFSLATLVAAGALLGARESHGADVSIEIGGGDYYGRDYGRPVYYGHPDYREDSRVASPPRDRRDRGRVEERRAPERHEATPPKDRDDHRKDGREATTPEPRNQHP
jgi:hypothetical protein